MTMIMIRRNVLSVQMQRSAATVTTMLLLILGVVETIHTYLQAHTRAAVHPNRHPSHRSGRSICSI